MANFYKAFQTMAKLEFSKPSNCLHKNPTESGLTYFGIYQTANPQWGGWEYIRRALNDNGGDIKATSAMLYKDEWLTGKVTQFYQTHFWNKCKLDNITSDIVATRIFCFAVNAGVKNGVKTAQRAAIALGKNIVVDGIIGAKSIEAFNSLNADEFNAEMKVQEWGYYQRIIEKNPHLAIYENGWKNRINTVIA